MELVVVFLIILVVGFNVVHIKGSLCEKQLHATAYVAGVDCVINVTCRAVMSMKGSCDHILGGGLMFKLNYRKIRDSEILREKLQNYYGFFLERNFFFIGLNCIKCSLRSIRKEAVNYQEMLFGNPVAIMYCRVMSGISFNNGCSIFIKMTLIFYIHIILIFMNVKDILFISYSAIILDILKL